MEAHQDPHSSTGDPGGDPVPRYADLLAAMGAESRLRIVSLLFAAHPDGLVVSEITEALGISGSTLSHHLDRLKMERLVTVQRQGTYLRYRLDIGVLRELVTWLASQCCSGAGVDPLDEPGREDDDG